MRTKPLRNEKEIVEFLLETDDELSDLSDSDFEDIMDATDKSSDERFSSYMNENLEEPPQLDPYTAGSSALKKRPRRRPNNAKNAKVQIPEPFEPLQLMRRHII